MNDETTLKFSGNFTLANTELKKEYQIPVQILYGQERHIIVIYGYKKDVQPNWLEAIITGVVSHFDLDRKTTVAMSCTCPLLAPGEEEPDDNNTYTIHFAWKDDVAIIRDIKEYS